jgi:hypothetical protein
LFETHNFHESPLQALVKDLVLRKTPGGEKGTTPVLDFFLGTGVRLGMERLAALSRPRRQL